MDPLQMLGFVAALLLAVLLFRVKVGPRRTRMDVLSARLLGIGFVLWALLLTFANLPRPWRSYSLIVILCVAYAPLAWGKIRSRAV